MNSICYSNIDQGHYHRIMIMVYKRNILDPSPIIWNANYDHVRGEISYVLLVEQRFFTVKHFYNCGFWGSICSFGYILWWEQVKCFSLNRSIMDAMLLFGLGAGMNVEKVVNLKLVSSSILSKLRAWSPNYTKMAIIYIYIVSGTCKLDVNVEIFKEGFYFKAIMPMLAKCVGTAFPLCWGTQ